MGILTYKDRQFYMDGKPYLVLSGAIHYFRVPREYWHDRLLKLKECGFNTVETYTCWNLHEPIEGEFDFTGNLDVVEFIKTAQKLGLNVILRPGPYICAEWEFGGFPAWILKYDNLVLRCRDALYLSKVRKYLKELLDRVRPYFAVNGGNIFMLQIENEYGSYGNDKEYLKEIVNIYRENEIDCLLFTSDGPSVMTLEGGALDEYLCVGNFGSNPQWGLKFLGDYRQNQPLMCGEYWCGWFDHWGDTKHVRPYQEIVDDISCFIDMGASINLYMFHGGTNFGFLNGANGTKKEYQPTVTSYDYGAPLTEAGDRTELYYKIRELIQERIGNVPPLTAKETKKMAYGKLKLNEKATLFTNLLNISKPINVPLPKYIEDIGQDYGYTLYRTKVRGPRLEADNHNLVIKEVNDRANIYIDGQLKQTIEGWNMPEDGKTGIKIVLDKSEELTLDILSENMGRTNYGDGIGEKKGINGVRFCYQHHYGWEMYPLDMRKLDGLKYEAISDCKEEITEPVFLRGKLEIEDEPCDTFVRLDSFKKGFVKVNGINIGRYFNEAGPQKTLYIPAPFLKKGENEIVVFESDGVCNTEIEFCDTHDLG